jgi:hypothetical protein
MDRLLRAGLYRTSCPPPDVLSRWQFHLLPADEELQVAAHVRGCPHCTRELGELDAVDDDLLSVLLERLQGVSRWLEATLVATTDPKGFWIGLEQSAPLGSEMVRSRGAPATQQRYITQDLDIFVGSQIGTGGRRLMGRLRPPTDTQTAVESIEVWLVHEGQVLSSHLTDARGYFVFVALSPGRYDLGFGWQEQAVMIRGVEV